MQRLCAGGGHKAGWPGGIIGGQNEQRKHVYNVKLRLHVQKPLAWYLAENKD